MKPNAQNTREALLEAALHCFAAHGFDGTSIRMIAQRSGRPLSLIGHHFGSKEGLYIEVFRYLFTLTPFKSSLADGFEDRAPRTRNEAIRQLREQLHNIYTDVCVADGDLGEIKEAGRRLWLMELRAPNPEIQKLFQEHLSPWVEKVRTCIQFLRPDLSEGEVAFLGKLILGMFAGQSLSRGIGEAVWGECRLSPFTSIEMLSEFIILGIAVESPGK